MSASVELLFFLSIGCVLGTGLKENITRLATTEGILLSGGEFTANSVEVFVPSTGLSCSLPSLPDERYYHTMDSLLICGGDDLATSNTCLSFTSGQWITSHDLVEDRTDHSSWKTEQGVVLMGGYYSPDTSEIATTTGEQSEPSFSMQYDTWGACSMQDLTSDSFFLTGGYGMNTVSRYGVLGWVEDLPSLVVERYYHGCGSFFRGDGTQVLLVAGGRDNNLNRISSTEVLTKDTSGWTLSTPLPKAVDVVRGVNVGGMFYITGGYDYEGRDEILGWLDDKQQWEEIGKMKMARYNHAATFIKLDDEAMEHCG